MLDQFVEQSPVEISGIVLPNDEAFRHLFDANNLFSNGHDSFAGAKIEFLRRIKGDDPDRALHLGREWSIPEVDSDRYEAGRIHVETMVNSADEITTDTVKLLGNNSLLLEAYTIGHIGDIISGGEVDIVVLERLGKVLKVFTIGKTDLASGNKYLLHSSLYAMEAYLKDMIFQQESPRVYALANEVAARTTGIDPSERYNVQSLTDLAEHILISNGMFDKGELGKGIQVVGSVAPVKSIISELTQDEIVAHQLEELTGARSLSELEDVLKAGQSPDVAIEAIIERAFKKYDKLRCRVLVGRPEIFDRVVSRIEAKRKSLLRRRQLLQRFGVTSPDNAELLEELKGYVRLTRYDGKSVERRKEPISSEPHKTILDHMRRIPNGNLGYAAAHIRVPVVVDTNKGKRLPIFEIQVRLGGRNLDVMYAAAEAVYDDDGDFIAAGITPPVVGAI